MSKKRNASAGNKESINKTGSHSQSDSPAGDKARSSEKTPVKRWSRREAQKYDRRLALEELDRKMLARSETFDRGERNLNPRVQELLSTVVGDPDFPDHQALSSVVSEIKTQFGAYIVEKDGVFNIVWYDKKVGTNRVKSTRIPVPFNELPSNHAFADNPAWWCKSKEWRELLAHLWSKVPDVNDERVKDLRDVKEEIIKSMVRLHLVENLSILMGQGYSRTEADSYIRDRLTEIREWVFNFEREIDSALDHPS